MSDQTDTLLTADFAETDESRDAARIAAEPSLANLRDNSLLSAPDPARAPGLPAWFQEARAAAWVEFEATPMPARTEQAWRYASMGKIELAGYTVPQAMEAATRETLIARSSGNARVAGKMVFANDTLLDQRFHTEGLAAQGVIWKPLAAALTDHADLFRKHFMTQEVVAGVAQVCRFAPRQRA